MLFRIVCSLLVVGILSCCGGGSGGGGASETAAGASSASSESSQSSASSSSVATSSSSSSATSSAAPAFATALSLKSPQGGSTAAVGNGLEGLWNMPDGGYALIDPNGVAKFFTLNASSFGGRLLDTAGVLSFESGSTYQIDPAAANSGTYSAKESLSVTFSYLKGAQKTIVHSYAVENAMAVTPGMLAGTWATDDGYFVMTVDESGNFASIGTPTSSNECPYTGKFSATSSGSKKNLLFVDFKESGTSYGCLESEYTSGGSYSGLAAVRLKSDLTPIIVWQASRTSPSVRFNSMEVQRISAMAQ